MFEMMMIRVRKVILHIMKLEHTHDVFAYLEKVPFEHLYNNSFDIRHKQGNDGQKCVHRKIGHKKKSETLTSTSRKPPGLELRIPTRATNRNNI